MLCNCAFTFSNKVPSSVNSLNEEKRAQEPTQNRIRNSMEL